MRGWLWNELPFWIFSPCTFSRVFRFASCILYSLLLPCFLVAPAWWFSFCFSCFSCRFIFLSVPTSPPSLPVPSPSPLPCTPRLHVFTMVHYFSDKTLLPLDLCHDYIQENRQTREGEYIVHCCMEITKMRIGNTRSSPECLLMITVYLFVFFFISQASGWQDACCSWQCFSSCFASKCCC